MLCTFLSSHFAISHFLKIIAFDQITFKGIKYECKRIVIKKGLHMGRVYILFLSEHMQDIYSIFVLSVKHGKSPIEKKSSISGVYSQLIEGIRKIILFFNPVSILWSIYFDLYAAQFKIMYHQFIQMENLACL